MSKISEVYKIDVNRRIDYRDTKYGVCISISKDKYFLINSNHREMYDDFEIKSSEYDFLNNTNRFIGCSQMFEFSTDRLIEKIGNINRSDMMKIMDKILKSRTLDKIEKDAVMPEIAKWLSDNP